MTIQLDQHLSLITFSRDLLKNLAYLKTDLVQTQNGSNTLLVTNCQSDIQWICKIAVLVTSSIVVIVMPQGNIPLKTFILKRCLNMEPKSIVAANCTVSWKCYQTTITSHENLSLISAAIEPASSRKPEPLDLAASCTSPSINCLLRQDDGEDDMRSPAMCVLVHDWWVWCHSVTAAGTS